MDESRPHPLARFLRNVLITALVLVLLRLALFLLPFGGTPAPTVDPTLVVPTMAPSLPGDPLESIDEMLTQAVVGNIAYNTPNAMTVDETVTVELLLSPTMSAPELATQLPSPGEPITATVEITPRMKAVLLTANEAFLLQPIHDSPEQVISTSETTRWAWLVTARKTGLQKVTLVLYRLVIFEGKEYWREVQTYRADINVNVTWGQRLQTIDWKWILGLVLTSFIIPAIKQWLDSRKTKKTASQKG